MLKPSGISSFLTSSSTRFFLSNTLQRPLRSSFIGSNAILSRLTVSTGLSKSGLFSVRFFSNKSLFRSRWKDAFKGGYSRSQYNSLNRFQQYQQGNGNSAGKITVVGISIMAGIFFLAPYMFHYVPPFTHFEKNPAHLVYTLLAVNVGVFGLWKVPRVWKFLQRYMLLEKDRMYSKWALIGSAFSHQELWHLGMNMLALWSFGTSLATMLGASNFFSLYMNSAIAGSLFSIWYPRLARLAMMSPSLGASGALFGVFGCFSYLFPHAKILLFVFPIPGGAWVAFLGAAAWNAAGCVFRWGSFDYAAHLGGSLIGVIYGYFITQVANRQREKRREAISRWI